MKENFVYPDFPFSGFQDSQSIVYQDRRVADRILVPIPDTERSGIMAMGPLRYSRHFRSDSTQNDCRPGSRISKKKRKLQPIGF